MSSPSLAVIRDLGLWAKLTAICMVISERVVNGVPGSEIRYYIGSAAGTAEEYRKFARGHWGIENSLHWVLDVCFHEDDQRHWAGNSAENLARLRKMALCLLKAEETGKKKSIPRRRLLTGWDNDYLLKVLAQIPKKVMRATRVAGTRGSCWPQDRRQIGTPTRPGGSG